MGVSWQFALPDESVCPPMPQRTWAATAKASLERTFTARDAQFKHATDHEEARFQPTEPTPLS